MSSRGWSWFDPAAADRRESDHLTRQFTRVFAQGDGEAVLAHLKAMTIERSLGPDSSDAALRFLEGQRQLVLHIIALAERGRGLS